MAEARYCPSCNYRLREYKGVPGYTPRFCMNCGFDFQKEAPRTYESVRPLDGGASEGGAGGASFWGGGSSYYSGAGRGYGGGFLRPLFALGMVGAWSHDGQDGAGSGFDGGAGGQADGYSALDDCGLSGDQLGSFDGGDFGGFGDFGDFGGF